MVKSKKKMIKLENITFKLHSQGQGEHNNTSEKYILPYPDLRDRHTYNNT